MSESQYDAIAIIGITGRFPGAATVEELWANLVAARETVSFFSDDELVQSGLDPAELRRRGRYVAARGVLNDIDCFDAAFFGVHPKEAEVMDPQQRVFLETCWEALERAGYSPSRIRGAVGVFAGSTYNTFYLHALHQNPKLIELVGADQIMFGNEKDYLTTRVAYKLGLKGPALNVATACSTSLVAVCQAVQSLLTYQCDVALAGAASITVPQARGYYFDDGQIGSSDGHTRTFDARATGTVFSNGVGVVVLKRLDEALADGDQIYAVIKGAAINNDGSERVSFGAPGVEGQSQVIAMAHALSGVDPGTITCVEAHGTATPLGDPIEVAALTKAFRLGTDARQFCALGSVKTNIGHLDVAAGVTGLIKMSLALHHKVIPASLHFTAANPKLDLEKSPFYVNTKLQDWNPPDGLPRRAGVSSFGTGGTNAHVVLEEAPARPPSGASRPSQLLVLSAKTPEALDRATANLRDYLKDLEGRKDDSAAARELADAAFTLQTGRSEFVRRRVVVCHDPGDAAEALDTHDARRVFTHHQQLIDPPVVFMFPGQGAQYPGMGAELYGHEPVFRAEVDRCASHLQPLIGVDLRDLIFQRSSDADAGSRLQQTRLTQPALFVIEYALARLWMSWGIRPAAMIGHSVGEYVAGCLAGVLTLEDALSLIARRGALVQEQPAGAMLAVRLPAADVSPLLNGQLAIAAINAPSLCVVSGPNEEIDSLERQLVAQGTGVSHLHTSHAFHSQMMDPVVAPFTALVRQVPLAEPRIPYVSNVTGRWITGEEATSPEYWAGHVRQTVRFSEGIGELLKNPRHVLLEVGPGQTLATLARQHPARTVDQTVLASLPSRGAQELPAILEALGRLWMTGIQVDWPAFYARETRRRVVLPTYPFERTRYWPAAERSGAPLPAPAGRTTHDANVIAEPSAPLVASSAPVQASRQTTSRKERLLAASRSLLQELSGYDFSTVDASADLLELGLDSLLLTQAAQVFYRTFGVSITFRQLMEELSSVEAIASYLDANLAAEPVSESPAAPAPAVALAHAGGAQHAPLEQLLRQQQELTSQLQQLLGQRSDAMSTPPAVTPPPLKPAPAQVKGHGPFRPLDRSPSSSLSPVQRRALDDLIASYTARTAGSKRLAAEQREVLADPRSVAGFNRLWKEMTYPIFTVRSDGSKIWDVDGNEYVDFVMGFSASLFGHRPPFVVQAVREQLELGFEIGPIQPLAAEVARLVREITGQPRVAFTNTGSEAVLAAMRLARTVTRRDKIAVFANAYHGIFDEVLFRPDTVNGEAAAAPIAPGIPDSALAQMIVLDYCDPKSLDVLRRRGSEIAAVLVEPVQARRLDLQPAEFLHELRRLTEQTGSALIIDEIVTGFRLHPAGAQGYFGVRADLATYGKVMGGGVPIGVVAGDPKFMDALDGGQWQYGDASFPEVGVTFFAGTFVRHPLALAAARATLTRIKELGPDLQRGLADRAARFADSLRRIIDGHQAPYEIRQFSSLMQLTFASDQKLGALLFYLLRERGIHAWENRGVVMTTSHDDRDLARVEKALDDSLAVMRRGGLLTSGSRRDRVGPAGPEARTEEPLTADVVPFTAAQLEVWLASQMSQAGSCAFNEALALELQGPLDPVAMERALAQVVARHESLRMTVVTDPLGFRVSPSADVPMRQHDLRDQSEERREEALQEILRRSDSEHFDLERGPLLRVDLIRLAPERYVLTMAAHHLVCDAWSFGVVLKDLAALYTAAVRNAQADLPAPLQARRFAEISREQRRSLSAVNAEAFWLTQFQTIPDPLELPGDRPRPASRSYQGGRVSMRFDAALARNLKKLATQHRTTLFAVLLAGFETLVYRLTGQDDFVVGIPVASQPTLEAADLVAHGINFVPRRAHLEPDATFSEYVQAVRTQALDISEHQNFTYGSLLAKLKLPHDAGRDPLVSISFTLEPAPAVLRFADVTSRGMTIPRTTAKRDLHLNVIETESGLLVEADYSTDLLGEATARRWLHSYRVLLEVVAAAPGSRIADVDLIDATERETLVTRWNDTAVPYPSDALLHRMVESQVLRSPDAVAIECEGESLSYRELDTRANQLAHRLSALGVGPEVFVGVCLERSLQLVIALCGILKAGGAYVPLDPEYPAERLAFMVTDADAHLVITTRAIAGKLPAGSARTLLIDEEWDTIRTAPATKPEERVAPEGLAYMIYTSGSTGRPKGALNTHRGICNRLAWMRDQYDVGPGTVILQKTPVSFDVSVWELFLPLLTGARMVLARPGGHRDPAYVVDLIEKRGVTMTHFVPSMLRVFLDEPDVERCRSLEYVICSGEGLPADLRAAFFKRLSCGLHNLYGPTEAAVDVTFWDCRQPSETPTVPIGRPVANTQIYILDKRLRPTPIGVPGELYIGGVQVGRGYHKRPELTAERFLPDPFSGRSGQARLYRTGDLCCFLPDGTINYLGRLDHQVKVRGFRIELGEIETALKEHSAVQDAVVTAADDATLGKRLIAYVVPASGEQPIVGSLRQHLASALPEYMIPRAIVVIDRLPLLANGKLDRAGLPTPSDGDIAAGQAREFVAPSTPAEIALAEIWKQVLGVQAVGVHEDFFDLGGHSLLAARAAMQIRDRFQVDASLAMFFEAPTIAAMAAWIEARRSAPVAPAIPRLHRTSSSKKELAG
jgi:amino acid adenylation domain-containing protein